MSRNKNTLSSAVETMCSALDFNSLILIYLFDNIIQYFSFKGFMVLWSVVTR
jgi:hypothetical protein